jgi:hypothetical protein
MRKTGSRRDTSSEKQEILNKIGLHNTPLFSSAVFEEKIVVGEGEDAKALQ